jgi:hypothetical protein
MFKEKIFEGYFYNPTKGNLLIEEVIEEMVMYMKEKPEKFYDIIIGCDSSSGDEPNFPLVVAILRIGEGGRFFLKKITYSPSFNKKFFSWKNRIFQEVFLSCEFATSFKNNFIRRMEQIPEKNKFNYQIRYIHADIGENGQTKDMIKEITGLILGSGFEPKIKPESFIASTLADRYS